MNLTVNTPYPPHVGRYVYFNQHVLETQTMFLKSIENALISDFLKFLPNLIKNLHNSVNQLDRNNIRHYLHQLKSSVALFNGLTLFTEINELEKTIDAINDREVVLRSHLIMQKSKALLEEVNQFQNENK